MNIKVLPLFGDLLNIGALGFYEYYSCLKCPIGGISYSKIVSPSEPPEERVTRRLIVGRLYHDVMDLVRHIADRQAFVQSAKDLVVECDEKYFGFLRTQKVRSIGEWPEVTKAIRSGLSALEHRDVASRSDASLLTGILRSRDDRFHGVPDSLRVSSTEAFLEEYKSTQIYDNGKVNSQYLEQLKFYSFLVSENYSTIDSFRCRLISLHGESYDISFTRDDVENYGETLNSNYLRIQDEVRSGTKCFDMSNCILCGKHGFCEEYAENNTTRSSQEMVFVVRGRVQRSNDSSVIVLSNGRHEEIAFTSAFNTENLRMGREYAFFSLKKRVSDYAFTGLSGVYEC